MGIIFTGGVIHWIFSEHLQHQNGAWGIETNSTVLTFTVMKEHEE